MNNRRTFLKIGVAGVVSFFVFMWNKLTQNHLNTAFSKELTFPYNKNKRITFQDDYIIVNEADSTIVYSAHCTHLGCKIDKVENDEFVCPCHGSRYNTRGNVLKGPAYKNLNIIPSEIIEDGTKIRIKG